MATKVTVNLPEETVDAIKSIARDRGTTVTEALRQVIESQRFLESDPCPSRFKGRASDSTWYAAGAGLAGFSRGLWPPRQIVICSSTTARLETTLMAPRRRAP